MLRKKINVHPLPQSAIYWNDYPVIMTDDSVGGEIRMAMHTADSTQVLWLKDIAPNDYRCNLVDVGGNVGLFSRQALIAVPTIDHVFIYEPDLENYGNLLHNLAPWSDRISFSNNALAKAAGVADFFYDPDNSGNYSLLQAAMGDCSFSSGKINTISTCEESLRWTSRPIIYKSDTQGSDELIATLIHPLVWDYVFAAILEIWRIPKSPYDVDVFRHILSTFGTRRLLPYPDNLTVDEVLKFATGTDGAWLDLVLVR